MRWPTPAGTLTAMRKFGFILGACALVTVLAAAILHRPANTDSFPGPSRTALAGLSLRQRIVAIAESQVGYSTQPANSYCNKYSAYWDAGAANCPGGERTQEWCADFAAWAWQRAGVHVSYGPDVVNGDGDRTAFSVVETGTNQIRADVGRGHSTLAGYVSPL